MAYDNYTMLENAAPSGSILTPKIEPPIPVDPTIRAKNIASLELLLGDRKERKLSLEELDLVGYKIDVYDLLKPNPSSQLFRIEMAQYSLLWIKKNEFLLTLTTEVLWM